MKNRYRLFRRGSVYYAHDGDTGKQQSLETASKPEAQRLLNARNEAATSPLLNLSLAKAYLAAHDPKLVTRIWSDVMADLATHGRESSRARCKQEMASKPFNLIRNKKLVETTADDLESVMAAGGAATNNYLRRVHNLALGMGWLAWPILPPKRWPRIEPKPKRGITEAEHQRIVAAETNRERRLYYELLWELGGAQSDMAALTADNVDWRERTVAYHRQKLKKQNAPACLSIGARLEAILRQLPAQGPLFPQISKATSASDRAAEFRRRCRLLGISGVSLHSYRYAWAERAKQAGYPERWAQAALGHASRAVHEAYAKSARIACPPLEDYESKIIPLARQPKEPRNSPDASSAPGNAVECPSKTAG
jgi:integrase